MAKVKTCALNLFEREQTIVDAIGTRYGLKTPQAIRYIINDWAQHLLLPQLGPDPHQMQLFSDNQSSDV